MADNLFHSEFNFHDYLGRTPLYIAVVCKNVEAVRELIKAGANVNAKCENGNTCLHRAMLCKEGDPRNEQIIHILLNNGQQTIKQLYNHMRHHEENHPDDEYESIIYRNTANIRSLNDMNKTPLYYASTKRKNNYGW